MSDLFTSCQNLFRSVLRLIFHFKPTLESDVTENGFPGFFT
jgi:hypothetical protein